MKPYLRKTAVFIFFGMFILSSCHKGAMPRPGNYLGTPPPPPSPPVPIVPTDTTGGTIYKNISWDTTEDLADIVFAYTSINPSPSISIDSLVKGKVEIFFQMKSPTDWIYVPFWDRKSNVAGLGLYWAFEKYPYNQSQNIFMVYYPNLSNYKLPVKVKIKIS